MGYLTKACIINTEPAFTTMVWNGLYMNAVSQVHCYWIVMSWIRAIDMLYTVAIDRMTRLIVRTNRLDISMYGYVRHVCIKWNRQVLLWEQIHYNNTVLVPDERTFSKWCICKRKRNEWRPFEIINSDRQLKNHQKHANILSTYSCQEYVKNALAVSH